MKNTFLLIIYILTKMVNLKPPASLVLISFTVWNLMMITGSCDFLLLYNIKVQFVQRRYAESNAIIQHLLRAKSLRRGFKTTSGLLLGPDQ